MTDLWYVGYGSNLAGRGMSQYLRDEFTDRGQALTEMDPATHEPLPENLWVTLHHRLYFAGASKTWGGPVAFLSLDTQVDSITIGRAFLLDLPSLNQIAARENGEQVDINAIDLIRLHPGEHLQLPVDTDKHGYRGKYNAALRLPDIEGVHAFTLTTNRDLPRAQPSPAYLQQILQGLTEHIPETEASAYLASAAQT